MKFAEIFPLQNKLNAKLTLPGSKSYTNRALIIAAIANGKTTLQNVSKSEDSSILISSLKKLGIKISENKNLITVVGSGGNFRKQNLKLNIKKAGTAIRFLTALSTFVPGKIILDGDSRMRKRPISDLVDSLKILGASIWYRNKEGFPPIEILGKKLLGGKTKINSGLSSQFISSLLLVSPLYKNGLLINKFGKEVSTSYTNITIDVLSKFGIKVLTPNNNSFFVKGNQNIKPQKYFIETDLSGASYFWGIAAITGSKIRIQNINLNTKQGDILFPKLLKKMGCRVLQNKKYNFIEVEGAKTLKPITANLNNLPDSAVTMAVVCAFAKGKSKLTGLSNLKFKESDRLAALKNELLKIGIKSKVGNGSIEIFGGKPKAAKINTYNDHRMVMSFAMAATKIKGLVIENPLEASKSFPEFWNKLSEIGINFKIK